MQTSEESIFLTWSGQVCNSKNIRLIKKEKVKRDERMQKVMQNLPELDVGTGFSLKHMARPILFSPFFSCPQSTCIVYILFRGENLFSIVAENNKFHFSQSLQMKNNES